MPRSRSQHVFSVLMVLAFLCAFVIPPQHTQRATPNVEGLFMPLSVPARWAGRALVGGDDWRDRRKSEVVRAEAAELRALVSTLQVQLDRERERSGQRKGLGPLKARVVVVPVVGGDAGTRETLQIRGTFGQDVREGQIAMYTGGVVGRVGGAGVVGGQIRLVTDLGFRVKVRFGRLRKEAGGPKMVRIATKSVLAEGIGDNTLRIRYGLTMEDAANGELVDKDGKASDGVWVIVDDPDWPRVLDGYPIAQVVKIAPRRDAPLFAEVTLQPATNLKRLSEVMVVTKE